MVWEEVSGKSATKMWYFVGATIFLFLGEDSSFASFGHDAPSKKMNIIYNNAQMILTFLIQIVG